MGTSGRVVSVIGRSVSALLLMTSLAVGAVGSPTPASADVVVRDHRPKDAWVEVVINKFIIHDDEDGFLKGSGELNFRAVIGQFEGSCANTIYWERCFSLQLAKADDISFSADSGQTITQNRIVPRQGDLLSTSLDKDAGVTLHPGSSYGIEINGSESDVGSDDQMGVTHLLLSEDSDWSIGTHLIRGRVGFTDPNGDFGGTQAHYSVELEVRRVALADLTPEGIKIVNREEGKAPEIHRYKEICLTVGNIGPKVALGYDVNFLVDDAPYKGAAGAAYPGDHDEVCARIPDPALGEHQLDAVIAGVPEMDLSNNEMKDTYVRTVLDDIRAPLDGVGVLSPVEKTDPGPSVSGQSGQTLVSNEQATATASADLAVTSIKVKDKGANGKSDCDPGKNDIVVNVKNLGDGKVSNLVVRLKVDDDDPVEKSLPSLDSGNDANVDFNNLQLNKGERKLSATVDTKEPLGETSDSNNTMKSTVNCQDK